MYEDKMDILQKELEQKFDEGRDEGIQIGAEKGRFEGKIEVAKNLIKAGISIDLIAESTGLPKTEIAQLKKEKPLS